MLLKSFFQKKTAFAVSIYGPIIWASLRGVLERNAEPGGYRPDENLLYVMIGYGPSVQRADARLALPDESAVGKSPTCDHAFRKAVLHVIGRDWCKACT